MTVRLIARNFADNRAINAPKFTGVPSRNSRIFDEFRRSLLSSLLHSVVKDPTATIVEREKEMFPRWCGMPPLSFN